MLNYMVTAENALTLAARCEDPVVVAELVAKAQAYGMLAIVYELQQLQDVVLTMAGVERVKRGN